jgi:hypothetical protein
VIGTLYVLLVRVSFISSALPDAALPVSLGEVFIGAAAAGLAVFFLVLDGGAVEPVFGILFSR